MSNILKARSFNLDLSPKYLVMGVLNVTPDSFYDGGKYFDEKEAVKRGTALASEGADIIDIGGESTRPGALPVGVEEQIRRVVPVIESLSKELRIPISIDTTHHYVAEAAVEAGASIINDISGLKDDPGIAPVAARTGAALVLMHMRGTPETMQNRTEYGDLIREIRSELENSVRKAEQAGVSRDRIAIDPGIGFAKTAEQNLVILSQLEMFKSLDLPIVIGLSRKSFLRKITGRPPSDLLSETITATVFAAMHGAQIHRVHDVAETRATLNVLEKLQSACSP